MNSLVAVILKVKYFFIKNFIKIKDRQKRRLHREKMSLLRSKMLEHYSQKNNMTEEESEVIKYLENNKIYPIPYMFRKNYLNLDIEVFLDKKTGLRYVLYDNKRLFFNRSMPVDKIKSAWKGLLAEQDLDSPHRYLTNKFNVDKNDVVVDIGAGEGNFALSVVEKCKKIYLFESDKKWIEALRETFKPWAGKVSIINKDVSRIDERKKIKLDSFFGDKIKQNYFLKIDAEGTEDKVLGGCDEILSKSPSVKVALCTYHNQEDFVKFSKFFHEKEYDVGFSKGYMIPINIKIEEPYLVRGLIRATKATISKAK